MRIYSIYDQKAEEFGPLMAVKNDAVAIRGFRMTMKDVDPRDFVLYCLGEFESEVGLIKPQQPKQVNMNQEDEAHA